MPTAPTLPTAPGTAPDPADRATFNTRAYAWTTWEKDHQVPEMGALGTNVYNNAVEAAAAASTASAAATTAASAAGATLHSAATNYPQYGAAISPSTFQTYRRKTAGTSATDPALDPSNWSAISAGALRYGALAANAIDVSAADVFSKTIAANTTFTVANAPTAGSAACFILELTNGGAYTITWWAGIKWVAGTAPSLSASGLDVLGFYTRDGGSTWRGFLCGKGMA